jgi:hypothetical protein
LDDDDVIQFIRVPVSVRYVWTLLRDDLPVRLLVVREAYAEASEESPTSAAADRKRELCRHSGRRKAMDSQPLHGVSHVKHNEFHGIIYALL